MGKYLQMLDELYQPEEKNQIPTEIEVTKPTNGLLSPFVTSNIKDIQFFSGSRPENEKSDRQQDKTVKASKQELTKPTKGIADSNIEKLTDQELAEHLVGSLKSHDDRVHLHKGLIGAYGASRLSIVNEYLDQWKQGCDAEPVSYKKDNAGRYRANVWLRQYFNRD